MGGLGPRGENTCDRYYTVAAPTAKYGDSGALLSLLMKIQRVGGGVTGNRHSVNGRFGLTNTLTTKIVCTI